MVYFLLCDRNRLPRRQYPLVAPYVTLHFSFINFFSLLFMVWRNANGYPLHTFLNRFFIKIGDSYFDFLGVAVFGGMALYLIWAVIKGNVKFGLRFVFFTFHPMK